MPRDLKRQECRIRLACGLSNEQGVGVGPPLGGTASLRLFNRAAPPLWTAWHGGHGEDQADLEGDVTAAWSKLEDDAAPLAMAFT